MNANDSNPPAGQPMWRNSLTLLLLVSAVFAGCSTQTPPAPAPPPTPAAPTAAATPPVPPAPPTAAVPATPAEPAKYEELPPLEGEGWQSLFDGQSLAGWKVTDFSGKGEVKVEGGQIKIDAGAILCGVNGPTNLFTIDYEVALDAMKTSGSDFFCGLTVPVADSFCTLIVGGWGGSLVGISSIDGNDASSNETTRFFTFDKNKWYRIRMRVTRAKLEVWIGKEKVVNADIREKRITMRPGEIEMSEPFGIATYETGAALKNIQWRSLK